MKTNQKRKKEIQFPGYPMYPASEDIYNRGIKEGNIDPEDINKQKEVFEEINDKPDYLYQHTADDLDIPGSEYDDEKEASGMEDEENNYYSLGGDNHNDLEETNTDLLEEKSD